jgi:hypothetical protein
MVFSLSLLAVDGDDVVLVGDVAGILPGERAGRLWPIMEFAQLARGPPGFARD